MRYNFTQLPDKLPYPPNVKAKLSTIHSELITYVITVYLGTFNQRRRIIDLFNTVSYYVIDKNSEFDKNWSPSNLFENIELVDSSTCKSKIGSLYLIERDINWDITPIDPSSSYVSKTSSEKSSSEIKEVVVSDVPNVITSETPKSDLYIQPPVVPRFNVNKVYASGTVDNCTYAIYTSEPTIPKRQNEISITTDISKMMDSDLKNLYPNHLIRTRAASMYNEYPGISYHSLVGCIFPIHGFTEEQVLDNIIKYPHLFRLQKEVDGSIASFYPTIEIDGELKKISDIWDSLPESDVIPYNTDFIKEYVVRRYLLERDINKVHHIYPLYGSLDPYLTLFTKIDDYVAMGYTDIVGIAKQCVISRIEYKRSRSPILRRLSDA